MKYRSLYARILGVAVICLASSLAALAGQATALTAGAIIDRVVCHADATQSYALYLPAVYTPKKQWPIIYCFDPVARGRVPVERLKAAAEKYGFIVVGSNNSRNGVSDVTVAVNAMINDTRERLVIDARRVYTAGFSGGGRVATSVALAMGDAVAGVIACGGGFSHGTPPAKAVPFVLFATAGTEDFNYPEMRQLTRALERMGVANRFATFEGGHSWLPPALAEEALAWLELQAMKAGRRDRDDAFITEMFNQGVSRARAAEAAGQSYEAYLRMAEVAGDFKGLRDVSEIEKRVAALKDDKTVKQAIKQEDDQDREQQMRAKELYTLRATIRNEEDGPAAYADLKKNLVALKKRADAPQTSRDRVVARRIINEFMVYLSEQADALSRRKQYAAAAENLTLATLVAPDNPFVLYNLACAYALNRDRSRALDALKRAVEKGFKDAAALEGDKDLEALRDDPAYKQIVEELKKKS
jgi:predicted esterase